MALVSAPTQEDQGDDDQGDGGHPGMLVGDASQDGIQSQKIPLGRRIGQMGIEIKGVDTFRRQKESNIVPAGSEI